MLDYEPTGEKLPIKPTFKVIVVGDTGNTENNLNQDNFASLATDRCALRNV